MTRRGPAGGYDFPSKRQYRRDVWATFRRALETWRISIASAQALLMPSTEGDEVEVALDNGVREYNLHVVDRNPAIVATVKRRFPRVNTYGVEFLRAVRRVAEVGVDVANLDFTSQLSSPLMVNVLALVHSEALNPRAAVAVTMLRGRESRKDQEYMEWFAAFARRDGGPGAEADLLFKLRRWAPLANVNDVWRFVAIGKMLTGHCAGRAGDDFPAIREPVPLRQGMYGSSNGQSMLWSAWATTATHYKPGGAFEGRDPRNGRGEPLPLSGRISLMTGRAGGFRGHRGRG